MDTEKSVGTILREARLAKGLTLLEAEKGTNIRSRYLQAVENDEYDKTPGAVFLKGIIHNYGEFLGLNGTELVNAYKSSAAGVSAAATRANAIREVEKVQLHIQLKNPRDIGSGTGKRELPTAQLKQIAFGVIGALIVVAGYFAVPQAVAYFNNRPQPVKAEQKTEVAVAPASKQDAKSVIVESKTSAVGEAKAEAKTAVDKVQVEMEANDKCWLEVNADGQEIFSGMLLANDKKSFEAKDKLIIKYGNIGAMKVTVNGESVDMAGEQGVALKTYALNAPAAPEVPTEAAEPKK